MIKVANLYAGVGGNRKLWQDVEVVAVEINPEIAEIYQSQFPNDTVIVGDAHDYLLHNHENFDFIWSSIPCQSHTHMMKATRHDVRKYPDMKLYEEIIFLQHFYSGKWVVENVKPYYEPLINPTAILDRHYFWSNFHIPKFDAPANPGFIRNSTVAGVQELKDWLGLQFEGYVYYEGSHSPTQFLRNCVHPQTGLHVLEATALTRASSGASTPQGKQRELFNLEPEQSGSFSQNVAR